MRDVTIRVVSPSYSVVIATCDREDSLASVLNDWEAQNVKPEKVVVVRAKVEDKEPKQSGDSSRRSRGQTKRLKDDRPEARGSREEDFDRGPQEVHGKGRDAGNFERDNFDDLEKSEISLVELWADSPSAAKQRNLGAEQVETEWVVFCDDDVRFGPDLAKKTLGFLNEHPEAVAVTPRMRGGGHPAPNRWLRNYYRLQAGFHDETYGAKLFGSGLSCYPCWEKQSAPVEANWLPSTMLWMKTHVFRRHEFPHFDGYSFGEDAHLTHRIWREALELGGKMYFLSEPEFEHHSIQSGVKSRRTDLGRMTIRNQQRIAREAMRIPALEVFWKSLIHRAFVTLALAKGRRAGWLGEIAGVWSA